MKAKTQRVAVSLILVMGLTVGAVSYVIRQVQSSAGGSMPQVANIRQTSTQTAKAVATQTATSTAASQGASGKFTGPTENAYYGYVKVQAVVSNGKVQKVVVLQHPNDNGTSRYINSVAMPYLVKEAVQAQGANINLVSGATLSSEAFVKSLGSALSQAGV